MTDTSDDNNRTLSTITGTMIPVSTDKTPLVWDGNDANILGLLYEVDRYYTNKGLFQTLIRDRAVSLSNGKLAIEHPSAVLFLSGTINDAHDFEDPCPPTVDRLQQYNDEIDLGTISGSKRSALTEVPSDMKDTVILAKHCVEKEDASLLNSLTHVFGHAESADTLIETAAGSGLYFLELLRHRGTNASSTDIALATTKFQSLIRNGVGGELTLKTFTNFLKNYKAARRNIAPTSRPVPAAEVEMISIIAIRDKDCRELYELKSASTPPTTLDAAAEILAGMLRGRLRCEEIDELESDPKGLSLVAPKVKPKQLAPNALTALAAAGLDLTAFSPEHMAALVSALAPADPRKNDAGKIIVPRDANGKPLKWIDGMMTCRCGINGGKHLFKDCPKTKEKKEKEARAKKAALAAAATGANTPSEDQLRTLLSALFTAAVPTIDLTGGSPQGDVATDK